MDGRTTGAVAAGAFVVGKAGLSQRGRPRQFGRPRVFGTAGQPGPERAAAFGQGGKLGVQTGQGKKEICVHGILLRRLYA
jgi:hypothetical protein